MHRLASVQILSLPSFTSERIATLTLLLASVSRVKSILKSGCGSTGSDISKCKFDFFYVMDSLATCIIDIRPFEIKTFWFCTWRIAKKSNLSAQNGFSFFTSILALNSLWIRRIHTNIVRVSKSFKCPYNLNAPIGKQSSVALSTSKR